MTPLVTQFVQQYSRRVFGRRKKVQQAHCNTLSTMSSPTLSSLSPVGPTSAPVTITDMSTSSASLSTLSTCTSDQSSVTLTGSAIFNRAIQSLYGYECPVNRPLGIRILQHLCRQQNPLSFTHYCPSIIEGAAHSILGFSYEFGLGIKTSFQRAEHHYLLATSILTTCIENSGESTLALMIDASSAIVYQACLVAVARLAFLRKYGRPGIKMDRREADRYEAMLQQQQLGHQGNGEMVLSWFRHAATIFNCSASQYCLGVCYHDGLIVSKDENEAFRWYKLSADLGNCRGQGILGYCYGEGFGIEKDETMAIIWYRRAAAQGETVAIYNIGYCYEEGIGVAKDISEAIHWYTLAAEQGNAFAQNALGYCYEDGLGVPKDLEKAVTWYQHSANQGYPWAQCNLGYCFQNGIGLAEKDPEQGSYW